MRGAQGTDRLSLHLFRLQPALEHVSRALALPAHVRFALCFFLPRPRLGTLLPLLSPYHGPAQ